MVIVEYNENWKNQFIEIKNILVQNLSKIISIEHIGSTAIKGMWAKPIIDIDIVINEDKDFETTKKELEFIGYYHNGDQGIAGREVFKRKNNENNYILDKIRHHLYICTKDNEELQKHILFRDYLNKNEEVKNEYIEIKKEILNKYGVDNIEKYVFSKENDYKEYFEKIFNKILEKSQTST